MKLLMMYLCVKRKDDVFVDQLSKYQKMINMMCHKAYAGSLRRSSVCTWKNTCQVAYAHLRSKFRIPRGVTMVLTHYIERWIIFLISSRNTISIGVVFVHGIDKS